MRPLILTLLFISPILQANEDTIDLYQLEAEQLYNTLPNELTQADHHWSYRVAYRVKCQTTNCSLQSKTQTLLTLQTPQNQQLYYALPSSLQNGDQKQADEIVCSHYSTRVDSPYQCKIFP